MTRKIFHIMLCIGCFVLFPCTGKAQIVNVETLRFLQDTNGLVGQLQGSIRQKVDEIMTISASGGVHVAYKYNKHSALANFSTEYGKVDEAEIANNLFIHMRYNYSFTPVLIGEAFLQTKYDDFLNIKRRDLYGTGIRLKIYHADKLKFYGGITGMFEHEELSGGLKSDIFRMSDYISLFVKESSFELTSTFYYQPWVADFTNYRLAWSNQVSVALYKKFRIGFFYDAGYDSKRPEPIKKYVYDIRGMLAFRF
ncbi:MAG: DUF481 domain-containing protein [Bacteroidales bacterium]